MSSQDKVVLQLLRSAEVLSGATSDIGQHFDGGSYPKLPEASDLEFGEIALNIARGYEVIAIKNYDGEIVYLPFNVAARLLEAETGLEELSEYAITSVDALSGATVSLYNDVESFKSEVRQRLSEAVLELSGDVLTMIDAVSADTNARIANTKDELEHKIFDVENYLELVTDTLVNTFSRQLDSISATTDSKFESLSATTAAEINELRDSISGVSESQIEALSAYTETSVNELNARINAVSGQSSSDIEVAKNELYQVVSGVTEQLHSDIDTISGYTQVGLNIVNNKVDSLSASTDEKIGELGKSLQESIIEATEQLHSEINTVSGYTRIGFDVVENKVDSLSGSTDEKISELDKSLHESIIETTEQLHSEINTVSGYTQIGFDAVENKVDSLSASTDEKISELGKSLLETITDVDERLTVKVDKLSGNTNTQIDSLREELIDIIGEASGQTEVDLFVVQQDLENEISELSASTDTKLSDLWDKIADISGSTGEISSAVTEYVDSKVVDVEEELHAFSASVITFSGDTVHAINELSQDIEEVNDRVDSLSGDVQTIAENIGESVAEFSASIVTQIVRAKDDAITTSNEYATQKAEGAEDNAKQYTDNAVGLAKRQLEGTISTVSGITIDEAVRQTTHYTDCRVEESENRQKGYTDEQVAEAKGDVIESTIVMIEQATSGLENRAVSRASAYTDTVASELSEQIREVASQGGSAVENVEEEVRDTNARIDNLVLNDLKDVNVGESHVGDGDIELLARSGNTWTNQSVGLASKDKYGMVKIGNGIDVNNGVISAQKLDVDQTIISGSTNPISGNAVYDLKQGVEAVDRKSEGVKTDLQTFVDGFNIYSGETKERIDAISGEVQTLVDVNDRIDEVELVHAGAFAQLKRVTGLNGDEQPYGNVYYNPTLPELEGSNMTEAIDIVGEIAKNAQGGVNNFNTGLENVEMVHAGAFARLNHSLGFNVNAEYEPGSGTTLDGMTVTEAIDYLYQWTEQIDSYLGHEDRNQLIRSITYENLVKLYQQKKLRWGMLYRITNYQATTNDGRSMPRAPIQPSGPKTNMGFDILVRATSNQTLDENVRFMMSENSAIFEDCNVESWEGKYCILNDQSRFAWADVNGYGVIYYLKDNYGNEAPYDFKNLLVANGKKFSFTFQDRIKFADLSLTGMARGNVIKPAYKEDQLNHRVQIINCNVFFGREFVGNEIAVNGKDITCSGTFTNCYISPAMNERTIAGIYINKFIGYTMENLLLD